MGKVHYVKTSDSSTSLRIPLADFDALVDEGYDGICAITPTRRLYASIDEWFDYSYTFTYVDEDEYVEFRVLRNAYMGRM